MIFAEIRRMEIKIASARSLPPGKMIGIEKNGKSILLANVKGEFFAIGNICMHEGCILAEGTLSGEKIECPCHGSTYDVRTGKVLKGPAKKPEPAFKLRVEGDQILANIDS
jgi:nitrite reductase/ring-hydroxylating ferredoxin subunit